MKKILSTIIICILAIQLFAQAPQGFNYQAVARSSNGSVLQNTTIAVRISILDVSLTGNIIYSELHHPNTNQFGLFTLVIGNGLVLSGNFASISWGNSNKFLKVELDPANGTNYSLIGTSQLLSVPYALYAEKAGNITTTGTPLYNQTQINNLTPTQGTMVYNTTLNCLQIYDGANWNNLNMQCYPQPSQAYAGVDIISASSTQVSLSANTPVYGTGQWSIVNGTGGSFQNIANSNSIFNGQLKQFYSLKWTITNSCGSSSDLVNVLLGVDMFTFNLGAQSSTLPVFASLATNQTFLPSQGNSNTTLIDLIYYYGTTNLGTFWSPDNTTIQSVSWGVVNWSTWSPKNQIRFIPASQSDFDSFNIPIAQSANLDYVNLLSNGNVYGFKTINGKYGFIKVTNFVDGASGNITIAIKIK